MLTHENFGLNDWTNQVKEYQYAKKILPWGKTEKPEQITEKIIKEKDSLFNPILQCYNNRSQEFQARSQEKIRKSEHLVKSLVILNFNKIKDKSLRYEQTFDVVNLRDKLKGFENHPDYPAMKSDVKKKKNVENKLDYNIVSNVNLNLHNYLPPEKRPYVDNNVYFQIKIR